MSISSLKTKSSLQKLERIAEERLTFASLLSSIRLSEEETQVVFSELLGVSKQYLCDLEGGRRLVTPKTAAEYAKKLGYSPHQFVRLCLQDILDRDGIPLEVDVKEKAA